MSSHRPGDPPHETPVPVIHDPFLQAPAPPRRRTPWLLIVAVTSTALFVASSAALVWLWQSRTTTGPASEPSGDVAPPSVVAPAPSASAVPSVSARPVVSAIPTSVPKATRVIQHGEITLVDLGVESPKTLGEELAIERAAAQAAGQTLVVTVTRFGQPELREFDATLAHPLMQEALSGVRLVRVDAYHYEADLDDLGIPTREFPWFFLLGPDLAPRDGLSGAEWDDNIPVNMAPVLGAWVKGAYKARKHPWKPPRSKGVQL